MIHSETIANLIETYLLENSLFLVGISISKENDIEVTIESTQVVDISNCVAVSKIIESAFDREVEDYSLTVTSAGLDQPFKVFKQYQKFIGKEVEVLFSDGKKVVGILTDAQEDKIELSFTQLEKVEGKKKRERINIKKYYNLSEVKSTKPFINFR